MTKHLKSAEERITSDHLFIQNIPEISKSKYLLRKLINQLIDQL